MVPRWFTRLACDPVSLRSCQSSIGISIRTSASTLFTLAHYLHMHSHQHVGTKHAMLHLMLDDEPTLSGSSQLPPSRALHGNLHTADAADTSASPRRHPCSAATSPRRLKNQTPGWRNRTWVGRQIAMWGFVVRGVQEAVFVAGIVPPQAVVRSVLASGAALKQRSQTQSDPASQHVHMVSSTSTMCTHRACTCRPSTRHTSS